MRLKLIVSAIALLLIFGFQTGEAAASSIAIHNDRETHALIAATTQPAVKKSKTNICHAKGSTYYNQTKHYTAYSSLKACLKSGGRLPKR